MKKVDSNGNQSNEFFDGNPTLAQPATLLEETWLNSLQREIIHLIEFAGLTVAQPGTNDPPLISTDTEQMRKAIETIALGGSGLTNITETIDQGQTNQDLADSGFLFDFNNHVAARMFYRIHRETDSETRDEVGDIKIFYRPDQADWKISVDSYADSPAELSGVTFNITAGGQLQYSSDTLAGASYAGTLKIDKIQRINA